MRECSSGERATAEGPGRENKVLDQWTFQMIVSEKSAIFILSWLLSFPGFQSFCCYSSWLLGWGGREWGRGNPSCDRYALTARKWHRWGCIVTALTWWICLEARISLGHKRVLALWFLSLHSRLCPHWFNVRVQWLGPQCSLHGIERNPGERSRAEFWRQSEYGETGKAHRMRNVERGKQERAGRPGLGGSWQWIEIYTKKAADKAIRDTSQGQKQNKRLNRWKKTNREGFRTEAREKEKGERTERTMWYSALIRSVRSWVEDGQGKEEKSAGLIAAILLPSGFYLWRSILSGTEEFPCSALRSVVLFPKEAGCQLLCAQLVIPTDSVKGSAFTGMCSNCHVQEQQGVMGTRAPSTMILFGCLQMSNSQRLR